MFHLYPLFFLYSKTWSKIQRSNIWDYLLSSKWLKMFHINFKQIFKGEYFETILEVDIFKGFIVSSFCPHLIFPVSLIHIHHFLVIKEKELTLWLSFSVRLICVELLMCCIHESWCMYIFLLHNWCLHIAYIICSSKCSLEDIYRF